MTRGMRSGASETAYLPISRPRVPATALLASEGRFLPSLASLRSCSFLPDRFSRVANGCDLLEGFRLLPTARDRRVSCARGEVPESCGRNP